MDSFKDQKTLNFDECGAVAVFNANSITARFLTFFRNRYQRMSICIEKYFFLNIESIGVSHEMNF